MWLNRTSLFTKQTLSKIYHGRSSHGKLYHLKWSLKLKKVKLLIAPGTFGTLLNIIYPYMWVRSRNWFFIMYIIEAKTDFNFFDSQFKRSFLIFISFITELIYNIKVHNESKNPWLSLSLVDFRLSYCSSIILSSSENNLFQIFSDMFFVPFGFKFVFSWLVCLPRLKLMRKWKK